MEFLAGRADDVADTESDSGQGRVECFSRGECELM